MTTITDVIEGHGIAAENERASGYLADHFTVGLLIKRIAQLDAEVQTLREALENADRFILSHHDQKSEYPHWDSQSFYGDHACAECHPHGEILKEGFQCAVHQAKARAAWTKGKT